MIIPHCLSAVSYTHLDVYKRQVKVKACEAVKKSKKLLQFTLDDGTGTDRTILSGIHAYYEQMCIRDRSLLSFSFILENGQSRLELPTRYTMYLNIIFYSSQAL